MEFLEYQKCRLRVKSCISYFSALISKIWQTPLMVQCRFPLPFLYHFLHQALTRAPRILATSLIVAQRYSSLLPALPCSQQNCASHIPLLSKCPPATHSKVLTHTVLPEYVHVVPSLSLSLSLSLSHTHTHTHTHTSFSSC
ncbi:hypothetical protein mRhiFer1_008051 [Rhinolophus ferrumequinum]|uniref:Uncharacterized protein n=1 Tax=Rhinolophus ferrumequinum TaxID=59479 RepID=A0A7J7WRA8_RHIFE|nr:hypothetical protein mRhiFer1_008051 [Rhinolophus ferrumequinum]